MSIIRNAIKKLIYGNKCDQKKYIEYLRKKGAKIGEDVNLFDFRKLHIDELNLYMLEIGNHVNIVGSTILTHDYAWSVIKGKTGQILGNQRPVWIGSNVFIGDDSIILAGTIIEDNVIIGARSVVSGVIKGNSVYAGNPVKRIMGLEEYQKKRESYQFEEAKKIVKQYKKTFKIIPNKEVLHEYFFLFTKGEDELCGIYNHRMHQCGSYDKSVEYLNNNKPLFEDYDSFINSCINENN